MVKYKVAPPFKTADFEILYNRGISREGEILDLGVQCDVVSKSGAWYDYQAKHLGQGKENARDYLYTNPKVAAEIEKQILARLLPGRYQQLYGQPVEQKGENG